MDAGKRQGQGIEPLPGQHYLPVDSIEVLGEEKIQPGQEGGGARTLVAQGNCPLRGRSFTEQSSWRNSNVHAPMSELNMMQPLSSRVSPASNAPRGLVGSAVGIVTGSAEPARQHEAGLSTLQAAEEVG